MVFLSPCRRRKLNFHPSLRRSNLRKSRRRRFPNHSSLNLNCPSTHWRNLIPSSCRRLKSLRLVRSSYCQIDQSSASWNSIRLRNQTNRCQPNRPARSLFATIHSTSRLSSFQCCCYCHYYQIRFGYFPKFERKLSAELPMRLRLIFFSYAAHSAWG
jgi:hypothetical protein